MMTVSPREALSSKRRISLPAVRSSLLLFLLAFFAASAFAQSLSPGGAIDFGNVDVLTTGVFTQQFGVAASGSNSTISIKSVTALTYGAPSQDFSIVSSTCTGSISYPNTCSITLAFTPVQVGLRYGALVITNTSNVVVNTIYLSGVGIAPQFAFAPTTAIAVNTAAALTPAAFTAGAATQDGLGNIFFTDVLNNRILERTAATGVYSLVVDLPVTATSGIALDGAGNLYISSGASVVDIPLGVLPYAATPLNITNVTLSRPTGLAVDRIGDLYIADSTNNQIYQLPPGTTTANTLTFSTGALAGPTGLAVSANNTLYIADSGNNRILENSLGSATTTVLPPTIPLSNPTGVSVDAAGTLYIADTGHSRIVEATVQADQFVLTEVPPLTLTTPADVLIQGNGDLVIADSTLGLVFVARSTPSVTFPNSFPTPTEVGTLDTADDPTTFLTVQGTGNVASTLNATPDPSFSGPEAAAFLLGSSVSATPSCPSLGNNFSIGEVCQYNLNFDPTIVGLNTASLLFTTTAAGGLTSSNTSALSGMGYTTLTHFSLVAISAPPTTPTSVSIGSSVELVLTALNSTNTVARDYNGDITFTTSDPNGAYLSGTAPGANTSVYTTSGPYTFVNGVLTIPVPAGLMLNAYGIWTATATVTDPTTLPPSVISDFAISNPIYVTEPTTLNLTSSVNPSAVGQSTNFTLTITATGPSPLTPAGTVTFYNNGVQIGSGPVTVTGSGAVSTASIPDSFAAPGSYPITATFTPTPTSYVAGGTAALTQLVGNTTGVTLTSSINPSLVGQSTNLTATVTSLGTFGAATGTIQFFDGATSLGTLPTSGAPVTLPASFSTAGTHNLTAVYTSSNINLPNATSPIYAQHVLNLAALVLSSSVNPSNPAQGTTLTAALTTLTASPGGTIKFYDGTNLIGTATLPADSVTVSFSTPGNHILTAVYSGDPTTETITSPPLTQVVLYAIQSATLTSSVDPVDVNANTVLTAVIKSTGTTPTGTVTFKSNGVQIGLPATLNNGVATITTSFTLPGTYTLIAVYGGDNNNQAANTNTVLETVLNTVNVALSSSVNPIFLDNNTLLTATLTTLAAGPAPNGTVSFFDGATPIGSGLIVNGIVSVPASFVYAGTHNLTAVYNGDAADAPASSPIYLQTVADFSLTIASGGSSSASTLAGNTATYNLVVTPIITATFPGPITLTVSGLPASVTGVLTPSTLAAGSGTTPVSLAATAAPIALSQLRRPPVRHSPFRYAPVTLALLALPLAWFRRRKRFASFFASILLLLAITAGLSGCVSAADTGYYGETPKTYNLTVTATSGPLTRSTYLTLTVQ
jgi:sugar lactone lactonase YvrE